MSWLLGRRGGGSSSSSSSSSSNNNSSANPENEYCKRLKKRDASLQSIVLQGKKMGDDNVAALADAIQSSAQGGGGGGVPLSITTIDLSVNAVGSVGAAQLAFAISTSGLRRTLQHLDLGSNEIGKRKSYHALLALADLVRDNETLSSLSLCANAVDSAGAGTLSAALYTNRALQVLNLGRNRIGSDGAMAMAGMLRRNRALTWIRLSDNAIGDEGMKALWEALEHANTTLRSLSLENNPINDRSRLLQISGILDGNARGNRQVLPRATPVVERASTTAAAGGGGGGGGAAAAAAASAAHKDDHRHGALHASLPNFPHAHAPASAAAVFAAASAPSLPLDSDVSSTATTDVFAADRQVMGTAMADPTVEPQPISVAYLQDTTNNFHDKYRLGRGAFGEVYKARDRQLGKLFVVKRIRVDLRYNTSSSSDSDSEGSKEAKFARQTFIRELTALKNFRHPNISTLYAFHMSDTLQGVHYLVFEYASNGSLDIFLKSEAGRVRLRWETRFQIAHDVASAMYFLHKGGTSRFEECHHRDIKSANICLKRDFTGLLIDCGLARFVPKDDADDGVTILSSSGAGVFGTLGYICPIYASHQIQVYESACDVYSFGIVLLELASGRLQYSSAGGSGKKKVNLYNVYRGKSVQTPLRDDVDELAGENGKPQALDEFCQLALDCTEEWTADRPSTLQVVKSLRRILRLQQGMSAEDDDYSGVETTLAGHEATVSADNDTGMCMVCLMEDVAGIWCHNPPPAPQHFLCLQCAKTYMERHIGKREIPCPTTGCRSPAFSEEDLSHVSLDFFKRHILERDRAAQLEKLIVLQEQVLALQNAAHEKLDHISSNLGRSLQLVTQLAAGGGATAAQCPKIIVLVPVDGRRGMNPLHWVGKHRFRLYFICEHSFRSVEPPLYIEANKGWVEKVAPLMKLGFFCLQAASAVAHLAVGLPVLPGHHHNHAVFYKEEEKLKVWNDCVNGLMQQEDLDLMEALQQQQGTTPIMMDKAKELVGESHYLVAEKAMEAGNRQWREAMCPVMDPTSGSIKWVKKEFEKHYQR